MNKFRKANTGRMLPEKWILGGICRETREVFMVAVPNRTADILLGVIREKIREGSTIMSDCQAAYNMVGWELDNKMGRDNTVHIIGWRRRHIQTSTSQPQPQFR